MAIENEQTNYTIYQVIIQLQYKTLQVYNMNISDASGKFSINSMQLYVFQMPVEYDTCHLNIMTSVLLTLGW